MLLTRPGILKVARVGFCVLAPLEPRYNLLCPRQAEVDVFHLRFGLLLWQQSPASRGDRPVMDGRGALI